MLLVALSRSNTMNSSKCWRCSCGRAWVDFTKGCFRMDYGGFHTGVLPHGRRQEYDRPLRGRGQKGAYPHYRQHSSVAHTTARHHRSPPLSGPEGAATTAQPPTARAARARARLRSALQPKRTKLLQRRRCAAMRCDRSIRSTDGQRAQSSVAKG